MEFFGVVGITLFILLCYFVVKKRNANARKMFEQEKELQNFLKQILQNGTEDQKKTALELYRKKQLDALRSLASQLP